MNRFLLTSIVSKLIKPMNCNHNNCYYLLKTNNKLFSKRFNSSESLSSVSKSEDPKQDLNTIKISDKCVERLKKVTDYENQYLRVEVESGGCSGFQYKFDISDQINADDRVFEKDGIKVVIDETSLQYINGSTIDYNEELIKSAFRVIENPKSEQGCSCGASFALKLDTNGFKF